MKKYCGAGVKRLLKLIFILIVFFFCFWLKNAVMWDAVYANNFRLSIKENRKIKIRSILLQKLKAQTVKELIRMAHTQAVQRALVEM